MEGLGKKQTYYSDMDYLMQDNNEARQQLFMQGITAVDHCHIIEQLDSGKMVAYFQGANSFILLPAEYTVHQLNDSQMFNTLVGDSLNLSDEVETDVQIGSWEGWEQFVKKLIWLGYCFIIYN